MFLFLKVFMKFPSFLDVQVYKNILVQSEFKCIKLITL